MQVLYMAQDLVAANLHAEHASAFDPKAPSFAGSGIVPLGSGGNFTIPCVRRSVRAWTESASTDNKESILQLAMLLALASLAEEEY
mmetsp:Transcript_654/g.1007  ORF Transcript_654/g.1007 Transcript_654/m.1007 type:complete len:86 (-) Transcript_654:25-282(-)